MPIEYDDPNKVKPQHVKPNFYSYILDEVKKLGKDNGYNILVHGSMNRDLDLICIPWVNEPTDELEMVQILHEYITGERKFGDDPNDDEYTKLLLCHSIMDGGRSNYVIQMARFGEWNNYEKDLQYYFDISFTPLVVNNKN